MVQLGFAGEGMNRYSQLGFFSNWHIWLVASTPLKNMKVSWDKIIPNIWKNKKTFQTTDQVCNWYRSDHNCNYVTMDLPGRFFSPLAEPEP